MMQWIYVGSAGVVGILLRYSVVRSMGSWLFPFPFSTFLVNLLGSFAAGAAYVLVIEKGVLRPEFGLALMIGFLGGFTTFSSFSLESLRLIETKAWGAFALYFFFSPASGLIAAFLGARLTRVFT